MEEMVMVVWLNKGNGQKLITIPRKSNIKPGDAVKIIKLEENKDVQ